MATNNKAKWISGVSVTTIIAAVLFYFTVIDRAKSDAIEGATLKASVEKLADRTSTLESSSDRVDHMLYGVTMDDGLINNVNKIKGNVEDIGQQMEDLKEQIAKDYGYIVAELRKLQQ